MHIQAVSRTRKWSCRVTAVAELLTGGGGRGGGEARPAALPRYSRGSARRAHGATRALARPRTSRPAPTRRSAPPPALPTRPGRPSLHHPTGSWGRRPARYCWRSWPRPALGPLARRHHDGGDRPVPGAHRALGDAATGEGAGGGQARVGKGRCLRRKKGIRPWGLYDGRAFRWG